VRLIVKTQKVMSMLLGPKVQLFCLFFAFLGTKTTNNNSVRSVFLRSEQFKASWCGLPCVPSSPGSPEILRGRFRATFGGANTIDDGIQ